MKSKEVISAKLVQDAKQIIETARKNAVRSVDFCRVQMYWNLGKRIFEEEQHGKKRADYGAYIVKSLAEKLEAEYGSGFGIRQIERARQFFLLYPIASAPCAIASAMPSFAAEESVSFVSDSVVSACIATLSAVCVC